jgi:hypothetical protein
MPVQTTAKTYVYFPDGCKVEASPDGSVWTDLGAINSDVKAKLEYDVNELNTANAGKLDRVIRNMKMTGGFTLINLDPTGIALISGGLLTTTTVAGSLESSIDNAVFASGSWAENSPLAFPIIKTTGKTILRCTSANKPTIASVTGSVDGVLAVNDDYFLLPDSFGASPSGWLIMFNVSTGTALTTANQNITVVFTSCTPVASTVVKCGTSTYKLSARQLRFTHTDDNGKVRKLQLFAADVDSGGFNFDFKGANSDGVEEMPLTFSARLDTSRTSGDQLAEWTVESGAL